MGIETHVINWSVSGRRAPREEGGKDTVIYNVAPALRAKKIL